VQREAQSQGSLYPLEYWKQWNEMITRAWTGAMHNDKGVGADPADFYTSWTQTANTIQERVTNNIQAWLDPREAWKLWLDTTMDVWRNAARAGGDPLGVIAGWVKVMENVQEKVYTGKSLLIDPFTLFNEWYNITSKPWSKLMEDIIGSEQLLEFTGPLLESQSRLISTFRQASEAYFRALRLPTLSDIAHVAELVIAIEEKIDDIEEAVEHIKEQMTPGRPAETSTAGLEQRLQQIESRLDRALALLEQTATRATESQ
jgi:polyhydroxyalkanoic acid synthase PhaR subunit